MNIKASRAAIALVLAVLATPAHADVLIQNDLAAGGKATLLTVAAGKKFKLSSAVFSSGLCNGGLFSPMYRLRILRNNTAVTSNISLGSGESLALAFAPELVFNAGQSVAVQNLDNSSFSCLANFMLQGTTCTTGSAGC